jgi:uncharacterized coiled-coil protein SlyX
MSEIRPRFYVHKQENGWIIVRMGSDQVVFSSATPSVPVWQKWHEWHDKNVEQGAWVEITYANMRPPTRELDDLKAELKEKVRLIEDLRAELDSESLNVQTLEQKLAIATKLSDGLSQEATVLNGYIAERDKEIKNLQDLVTLHESVEQGLHRGLANRDQATSQLKKDLDEATKTITSLNRGLMDRDNLIDGLRKEVDRLTKSNENLSQEIGRVNCDRTYGRGRIKTLREELAQRDETIQLLTSKLGEKGDEIKALREEVGRADDLRADIACRDETITRLNDDLCSSRLELAQARNSLDVMRAMQAGQERGWTYTKVDTSVPPTDIAGNPIQWSTNGPVAQIKATVENKGVPVDLEISQPLKFAPMPMNDVGAVDLKELQKQIDQNRKDIHSLGLMTKAEDVKANQRIDELQSELRVSIGNLARSIGRQITNMDDWVRVRTAGLQHDLDRRYVCEDGKVVEAYQRTADGRTPPGKPFVFSDKDPGKQYEIEGLQEQIDELTKRFHEFRNYAIARDTQKDGLIATLAKRVQTLEEKP